MIFPIYKPSGITSSHIVNIIKKAFFESGRKIKIGHSGTLDPICTGVLPILTESHTKLSDYLPPMKEYKAGLLLGVTTDTEDITGNILEKKDCIYDIKDVLNISNLFLGKIKQTPPMYSAIKKNGVRLYDLARKGVTVDRPQREINIYSIDVVPTEYSNKFVLDVKCSPGTYIRTLCADIGNTLGSGGCMYSLQRTLSGGININQCVSIEDLLQSVKQLDEEKYSIKIEKIFEDYPVTFLDVSAVNYCLNGGKIDSARFSDFPNKENLCKVFSDKNEFMGIGTVKDNFLSLVWKNQL